MNLNLLSIYLIQKTGKHVENRIFILFLKPFMGWQGHNRNMHRANNCSKGMRGSFRRLHVLTLAVRWCVQGTKKELWCFQGKCFWPERVSQDVQGMCTGVDRGCIDYAREINGGGKGWQGFFIRIGVFRSNRFTLLWL